MANPRRTKAQAASDRRALKILRDAGLYKPKAGIRSAPTRSGRAAIRRFADVISGAAVPVKFTSARRAARYKSIFTVKNKTVIVPRRSKKERIGKEAGEIVIRTKTGRVSRRQKFIDLEKTRPVYVPGKRYGLPFNRGAGNVTIMWFPSRAELDKFVMEYEYKDYERWIIEEDAEFDDEYEDEE